MLTPDQFSAKNARLAVLMAEVYEIEAELRAVIDELFTVTVKRPEGEQHRELIRNSVSLNMLSRNPWAVPIGKWVNVAPGVWRQRTN